EHAQGLDLRRLTLAAMSQLEKDLGTYLPPWLAAEHRNTAHPHVHVVLAARREVAPGEFRALMLTKPRLARMKEALAHEIERQRRLERPSLKQVRTAVPLTPPRSKPEPVSLPAGRRAQRWRPLRTSGRWSLPGR